MKSLGIKNFKQFEAHCKKVEDQFWHEMFPVYAQWRDDINVQYRKVGFIESHLGFCFRGYMSRNKVTNYQTQGTAFHLLLKTLILCAREFRRRRMESRICGQIHDSMVTLIYPPELQEVLEIIEYYGTKYIPKIYRSWLKVPLRMEHEYAPPGKTWYDKKEVKLT
jgi:DNA polymerase I-like protein with 3'-5' exonuclease and polymerase domains